MPVLEADIAVLRGRIIEGFSMPFPVDTFYETVFMPGFSDTHMHPQVVDGGLEPGRAWRNSYEWLNTRQLHVDEAKVRGDIGLSSRLAELAMYRALLEGTTLVAFTGRLEANLKAKLRAAVSPRLVLLPTVMRKEGWSTPTDLRKTIERYKNYVQDSLLRLGVFVHSLAYSSDKMLVDSIRLTKQLRGPIGIHLSEGVSEKQQFSARALPHARGVRIVAVHCLNDSFNDLGLRCSSCPATNALLYRRLRGSLDGVTSFGSDWPHLVGTTGGLIPAIIKAYSPDLGGVLYRATVGGYEDYGMSWRGDIVGYDGSLEDVLRGKIMPSMVSVAGNIVVSEGEIVGLGLTHRDVVRETVETIRYAVDMYGDGTMPRIPSREEIVRTIVESSLNPILLPRKA
ncbi:MAG: hypothetical protein LRS48_02280 [Desulfurococcales archaeon]|nr:hypothetical protein [Desulfurococcales archaeon]